MRKPKKKTRGAWGQGTVYRRKGSDAYYFRIGEQTGACRTPEGPITDRKLAIEFKDRKRLALTAAAKPAGVATVAEVVADYLKYIDSDKPKSASLIAIQLQPVKELLGAIVADKINTDHTDAYRVRRESGPDRVLFSTANRELAYLRAALNRAMKRRPQKVTSVAHINMRSEKSQVREGFIEDKDYLAILEAVPDYLKCILVVGFHTGARSGELKQITWNMVQLDREVIEVRAKTAKGDAGRYLPVWGDQMEFLKWQKAIHDRDFPESPWVFSKNGRKLGNFLPIWKLAVAKVGMPDVLFHDLRRSAIKFADQESGLSSALVRLMSGHQTEATYRRYNIAGERDMPRISAALNEARAKSRAASG